MRNCCKSNNDCIYGGKNSDTLIGCSGNDTLSGSECNQNLWGGIGNNDVFVLVSHGRFDTIGDLIVGDDKLAFSSPGLTFDRVRIARKEGATFISLSSGQGLVTILGKPAISPLI